MQFTQIILLTACFLRETTCATTSTTVKTTTASKTTAKSTNATSLTTNSSSSSDGNLEWLPYLMGVILAIIGIFLIAVISYTIYIKFFKFKKIILVSEVPSKEEQPTPGTTQIAIKTVDEPEQEIVIANEQTTNLQGSKLTMIETNKKIINSKEETLKSSKNLEQNDAFHLPNIFPVRQSEQDLNEAETESIKSVSTVLSDVPKKIETGETTVQSAKPIDYSLFSTRIAPISMSNDKKKVDNTNIISPSLHLPLPSKIYPINREKTVIKKRKRIPSPKEVEVTSTFVRSANKLWYSIDPQIDNNEFREIKNNRKFAVYAYNQADDQGKP